VKSLTSLAKTLSILTAVALLSACSSPPVVGVLLPITGSASSYGESMKNGIDLALEEAQGTLPKGFQIVWGDTASDPATGADELRRMAAMGARIVVAGTTSDTAHALLPVLEESDVIAVSPSASDPSLTKESRMFFRVFSSDELEGRRAGRFLYDDQDKTTVLIYAEDTAQARGIEPPFRQVFEQAMGGEVVGRVVINSDGWEQESSDILAAARPSAVYVLGYGEATISVLRHLREQGFSGLICASSSFYTNQIVDSHPDLVEGVFFPQPAFDVKTEGDLAQNFVAAYRQHYGVDPDIYAAHAYDAIRVVIWTIAEAKAYTTSEIRKVLAYGMKEFPGVTGIIQFNDYGDVHHNPIMFIIRDGQVLNFERYIDEERAKIRERIKNLLSN
jgi:branched-chain amino acid transport system substrate-binding protein